VEPTLDSSVFLVESADFPANSNFGTAFLVANGANVSLFVSCAHVIRDIGGPEKVRIDSQPATVVAISEESTPDDVAVLRVEGHPRDGEPLVLDESGDEGMPFSAVGFRRDQRLYAIRQVRGALGAPFSLYSHGRRIPAWELVVEGSNYFQKGYSGAPVVRRGGRTVLAVVIRRSDEGKLGFAISVKALTGYLPERRSSRSRLDALVVRSTDLEPIPAPEQADASWVILDRPERVFADEPVRLYPAPGEVERLVASLTDGVPAPPPGDPLIDRCRQVVQAAIAKERVEALIRLVSKQHPRDQQWIDAVLAYREHQRSRKRIIRAGTGPQELDESVLDQDLAEPLVMVYVNSFRGCLAALQRHLRISSPDPTSSGQQIDVTLTPVKVKFWDLTRELERVRDVAELPGIEADPMAAQLRDDLRIAERLYAAYVDSMQTLVRSQPASAGRTTSLVRYRTRSDALLKQLWKTHGTLTRLARELAGAQLSSG
jgi:Trypsin-like peptidase domain